MTTARGPRCGLGGVANDSKGPTLLSEWCQRGQRRGWGCTGVGVHGGGGARGWGCTGVGVHGGGGGGASSVR